MTKDIIATYRSFALPVDGDDWELGGSGQRGTQVTFAHVVEAHTVYTIPYETHQHADERAQCVFASQRIILRVQDRQDSSARTVSEPRSQNKATHESSNAHNTLRVFHSLTSEARKPSHESLKLAREGETFNGTLSAGIGNTVPVV